LIVEDEPFVGFELAHAVQRCGGQVIGPVPTVAEALALLDITPIDAAILDVQLLDGDITPVALRLIALRTPIVIQTGTGLPEALHVIGIDTPVVMKPVAPERLLDLLSAEMKKRSL
jgi:DNA-binding response OmpR family regulator